MILQGFGLEGDLLERKFKRKPPCAQPMTDRPLLICGDLVGFDRNRS